MRNHWAACALAGALIATWPATSVAQTPAAGSAQASTAAEDLSAWGMYAKLVGQAMTDENPSGLRLRWRWETKGEVLLEEWFNRNAGDEKPAYVMTIRRGAQPGTLNLKSSAMLGKEWTGTLQDDGSISFVGKGILKMRYTVRINERGQYEQSDTRGHTYIYAANTLPAPPVEAASSPAPSQQQTQQPQPPAPQAEARVQAQTPQPTTAPPAVVAAEQGTPAPAATPVTKPKETVASTKPVKPPRKLSPEDLARLRASVQKSREVSIVQARQAELQSQEQMRQIRLQMLAMQEAEARRLAEEAEADAEFEAERARKAAAWQQMAQANEQALNNSLQNLRDTTARIQSQQAYASQQASNADPLGAAERQRQVELIRQANQRQDDEAARLAALRQQSAAAREASQPQAAASSVAGAGRASTDTDANRCVSRAEVRQNDTFQGNTAAYVSNGCGAPVDVKVCLMTESGWKCGVTWGLAPQGSWSYSAFNATGPVFVDAKTAGSSRALATP